jgi:hypothetical protein
MPVKAQAVLARRFRIVRPDQATLYVKGETAFIEDNNGRTSSQQHINTDQDVGAALIKFKQVLKQ